MHERRKQELKRTLSTIAKHVSCLIKDAENRARDGDSPNPTARGGLGTFSTTGMPVPATEKPETPAVVKTAFAAAGTASAAVASVPPSARTAPLPPPPLATTSSSRIPAPTYDLDGNARLRNDKVVVEPRCCTAAARVNDDLRNRGRTPRLSVPPLTVAPPETSEAPAAVDVPAMASTVEVPARTRVLRRVSSIRALFLGAAKEGARLTTFSRQMGLPHDVVVAHVEVRYRPPATGKTAHRWSRVVIVFSSFCPIVFASAMFLSRFQTRARCINRSIYDRLNPLIVTLLKEKVNLPAVAVLFLQLRLQILAFHAPFSFVDGHPPLPPTLSSSALRHPVPLGAGRQRPTLRTSTTELRSLSEIWKWAAQVSATPVKGTGPDEIPLIDARRCRRSGELCNWM